MSSAGATPRIEVQTHRRPPPPPKKPPGLAVSVSVAVHRSSDEHAHPSAEGSESSRVEDLGEVQPGETSGMDLETLETGQQNNDKSDTTSTTANDNASSAQTTDGEIAKNVSLTGVGRKTRGKSGEEDIVDEALWILKSESTKKVEFPLVISKTKDQKIQLTIASSFLIELFKSFLKRADWRYITKSEGTIILSEPYQPLFFFYDEILEAGRAKENLDESNMRDLNSLKYWYEKYVAPIHYKIKETLTSGWVVYDDLWALFRPGDSLYSEDAFKQPCISVISASVFRSQPEEMKDPFPRYGSAARSRFVVESWHVDWEYSSRTLQRTSSVKTITQFSGTRRVEDLEFVPLQFLHGGDEVHRNELVDRLTKRGHEWKRLASSSPSCLHHEGVATEMRREAVGEAMFGTEEKENKNLSGRVIVDHSGYSEFGENSMTSRLNAMMSVMFGGKDAEEAMILVGAPEDMEGVPDRALPSAPFSDLQAMLCPSTLHCYSLQRYTWYLVTLANLTQTKWEKDALGSLVMNDDTKDTLRCLVEEHKHGKQKTKLTDFILGKGQALVVVLHGPPGVGKTLTAESIAEYTEKPLYSINIGEVSSEKDIVNRLQKMFELSARWDAVLLMDEADVVLEKRSYQDMKRNAIVSNFLRMLEYYRGILFLTTNRLGTMDIAFQSRVTMAVKYDFLTYEMRCQIWTNFIERLNTIETRAKRELTDRLEEIGQYPLNGRQIRNVLKMAESIAIAKNKHSGAMTFQHVEQIALETIRFQGYFDDNYRDAKSHLGNLGYQRSFVEKQILKLGE